MSVQQLGHFYHLRRLEKNYPLFHFKIKKEQRASNNRDTAMSQSKIKQCTSVAINLVTAPVMCVQRYVQIT